MRQPAGIFAVIYIPDFYLQAALRMESPAVYARPVGLIDATALNPTILQLTQSAREVGVSPGMTVTQAMARCSKIAIKARSAMQEQAANAALLDCAWAFSPNVEATGDGVCTLDLKGHARIDYEAFGAKILDCLLRLRLAGQVGIAENPLLAWHAARAARPCMVVKDAREFLKALPVETVEPTAETRVILKKWGIHTLGEFLALGKNALAERLGAESLELFDRASATATRPLRLANPPQVYEEAMDFEHEVETAEALLFVLRRFVEQLSLRLEMVYLVADEMTLRLMLADGDKYEHVLKIPAPTRKIETLFGMLQTHLEALRTEQPIVGVHLAVRPCRSANQQLELFESDLRDPNRFYETLARLTALVGSDRVGTPVVESSHRPDAFQMKAPSSKFQAPKKLQFPSSKKHRKVGAWSLFGAWNLELGTSKRGPCLRRFRPPARAAWDCRILRKAGPWHLSGHWWDHQRWFRVEWDIQTEDEHLYRIMQRNGHTFLDAIYD
jgi:nucleotidyltransferase/DNA polymerase involved in DNA repair